VGERTAEWIKINLGNAYPTTETQTMEIKGRDLVTGIPRILQINSDEIREAIMEPIHSIIEAIKITLERTPPELAGDIVDKGIMMAGGGALLRGIDKLVHEETGLPVSIAEDPLSCVVLGSGKALDELNVLREIALS
jgi:rod shape-determining protein MreB